MLKKNFTEICVYRNLSAYKEAVQIFCSISFLFSFYCIPVLVNQICTAVVMESWRFEQLGYR